MDDSNTFSDNRGTIADLLVGKNYSVTSVTFTSGAVRGNHYHKETTQVDVVLKGKLLCKHEVGRDKIMNETILAVGDSITHESGEAHAYKALMPSEIVSVCIGKRIGKDYEKDTFRLHEYIL